MCWFVIEFLGWFWFDSLLLRLILKFGCVACWNWFWVCVTGYKRDLLPSLNVRKVWIGIVDKFETCGSFCGIRLDSCQLQGQGEIGSS